MTASLASTALRSAYTATAPITMDSAAAMANPAPIFCPKVQPLMSFLCASFDDLDDRGEVDDRSCHAVYLEHCCCPPSDSDVALVVLERECDRRLGARDRDPPRLSNR